MGLFNFGKKEQKVSLLQWVPLVEVSELENIVKLSKAQPVLIFKHSTRCSISSMALNRLQSGWEETAIIPYCLDLLNHRDISNEIVHKFNVLHQSPQVLLIKDGECVYDESHGGINFQEIKKNN